MDHLSATKNEIFFHDLRAISVRKRKKTKTKTFLSLTFCELVIDKFVELPFKSFYELYTTALKEKFERLFSKNRVLAVLSFVFQISPIRHSLTYKSTTH